MIRHEIAIPPSTIYKHGRSGRLNADPITTGDMLLGIVQWLRYVKAADAPDNSQLESIGPGSVEFLRTLWDLENSPTRVSFVASSSQHTVYRNAIGPQQGPKAFMICTVSSLEPEGIILTYASLASWQCARDPGFMMGNHLC